MTAPDPLVAEIMRTLEIDTQWLKHFDGNDVAGITEARSAGRKAARRLGLKVRTYASDPNKRADHKTVVVVLVVGGLSSEDQKRVRERSNMLITRAVSKRDQS